MGTFGRDLTFLSLLRCCHSVLVFIFDHSLLSLVKCNEAKDTANLSSKRRKLEMGES